jgi:hypothetical protein
MSRRRLDQALGGFGAALLAAALACVAACHGDDPSKSDEAMLLQLSEARALQRAADLKLIDGDVEGAMATVREVLAIRFPAGAPETEDVLLDAHARLARLALSRGGPEAEEQALAELEAARRTATHDSFFRAHIENIAADVYAARAKRLTDPAAQKEARRQEAQALTRVIEIDRRLQRALFNTRENARDK